MIGHGAKATEIMIGAYTDFMNDVVSAITGHASVEIVFIDTAVADTATLMQGIGADAEAD